MKLFIQGEAEVANPSNGTNTTVNMTLSLILIIPNLGPPSFKFPLNDVKV